MRIGQIPGTVRVAKGHRHNAKAFTLVETMIAAVIFTVAITAIFLAYGQSIRLLDGLRQTARAEDILLANIEFLRTRNWNVLTNIYTTTSATTPPSTSSNLTESIKSVTIGGVVESPVCTELQIITGDPLRVGIKNARRGLVFSQNPVNSTTTVLTVTVIVSWDSVLGRTITNSMTTYITKGGMTADVL